MNELDQIEVDEILPDLADFDPELDDLLESIPDDPLPARPSKPLPEPRQPHIAPSPAPAPPIPRRLPPGARPDRSREPVAPEAEQPRAEAGNRHDEGVDVEPAPKTEETSDPTTVSRIDRGDADAPPGRLDLPRFVRDDNPDLEATAEYDVVAEFEAETAASLRERAQQSSQRSDTRRLFDDEELEFPDEPLHQRFAGLARHLLTRGRLGPAPAGDQAIDEVTADEVEAGDATIEHDLFDDTTSEPNSGDEPDAAIAAVDTGTSTLLDASIAFDASMTTEAVAELADLAEPSEEIESDPAVEPEPPTPTTAARFEVIEPGQPLENRPRPHMPRTPLGEPDAFGPQLAAEMVPEHEVGFEPAHTPDDVALNETAPFAVVFEADEPEPVDGQPEPAPARAGLRVAAEPVAWIGRGDISVATAVAPVPSQMASFGASLLATTPCTQGEVPASATVAGSRWRRLLVALITVAISVAAIAALVVTSPRN